VETVVIEEIGETEADSVVAGAAARKAVVHAVDSAAGSLAVDLAEVLPVVDGPPWMPTAMAALTNPNWTVCRLSLSR